MKIEKVHIMEMCVLSKIGQIEAYTLVNHFSFTNKMDIWL
jgi:hypothetical protein